MTRLSHLLRHDFTLQGRMATAEGGTGTGRNPAAQGCRERTKPRLQHLPAPAAPREGAKPRSSTPAAPTASDFRSPALPPPHSDHKPSPCQGLRPQETSGCAQGKVLYGTFYLFIS